MIGFDSLPVEFYARDARDVARDLIGCILWSMVGGERTGGAIVETEAYLENDPASHSFCGQTYRNRSMFGPPGRAYVYRSYGVHWCLNVVTGVDGRGEAVLIRALEPIAGLEVMRRRRGSDTDRDLCRGPGRLCQALGVTGELDGLPLQDQVLWIEPRKGPAPAVIRSSRVGIIKATDKPWRYLHAGSTWVSRRP